MKNSFRKKIVSLALALLTSSCAEEPIVKPEKPVEPYSDTLASDSNNGEPGHKALTGIYAESLQVKSFIQYMVRTHGFSEDYLNGLFSNVTRLESVIRLENAQGVQGPKLPPSPGSWTRYRKQFLTDAHINNGVQFWSSNADVVQKASVTYGVDPEYIVAIIGVETFFGRNVGKTHTFDALSTLAFDTQRRSKFFTTELENFLLMSREESIPAQETVGSWAGALGLGQFMPSSFRKLAVDFDHDGRRNLWQPHDAIGSVAHYFAQNGWQPKHPVTEPVRGKAIDDTITLSTDHGNEFWRVHPNFKVIKKYNNSDKYAMAVHQLAQAIKQRYN
ncbi:MAG: lytic murein transglycosylase [Methylococcales bacterium]|nr:transglycosylase SLT domain-containing protein [Methylococcaceae bacterium]